MSTIQAKNKFTTKRLALSAIFTALAYLVSLIEFPIFPSASYLKLDLSFSLLLICGFMLGAMPTLISILALQIISLFTTKTGGVGELANFIIAVTFVLLPAIVYTKRKGIKVVVLTLILATISQVIVGLVVNRYILFPLYMGTSASEQFTIAIPVIIAFNLIKGCVNSIVTLLLYKKTKKLFKRYI